MLGDKANYQRRILANSKQFIDQYQNFLRPNNLNFTSKNQYDRQSGLPSKLFPFGLDTTDNTFFESKNVESTIWAWILKNFNNGYTQRINLEKQRPGNVYEEDPNFNNLSIAQKQQIGRKQAQRYQKQELLRQNISAKNYERRRLSLTSNNLSATDTGTINIRNYKYFMIQTLENWNQIKNKVNGLIDSLKSKHFQVDQPKKGFFDNLFSRDKQKQKNKIKTYHRESLQNIENIIGTYFLLIQSWLENPLQNYPVRIICIHNDFRGNEGHLYIYEDETYQNQRKIPLTLTSAENLRRKLIFTQYAQRNIQRINEIHNNYLNQTKKNLGKQIMTPQNLGKILIPELVLENRQLNNIASGYPKKNAEMFIMKWKQKANQYSKNANTFQYFQYKQLLIPKSILARQVKVQFDIDNRVDNRYDNILDQQFKFSHQNQNSFVFNSTKSEYIYSVNLDTRKVQFLRIAVSIIDQSNNQFKLSNVITLSKYQNQNLGYSYELGLIPENKAIIPDNFRGDFPFILTMETATKKGSEFQIPNNLIEYRSANLLQKVGKIPNIYGSYYSVNYTPDLHPIISQILTGKPQVISQRNFWGTYINYVNFFQRQDSKSQNFCEYLKIKGQRSNEASGFVMGDRYENYCRNLQEHMSKVEKNYQRIFSSKNNLFEISKQFFKKDIRNINQDIKSIKLISENKINNLIQRFIFYHQLNSNSSNPNDTMYNSSLLKIANLIAQIYHRSTKQRVHNINQLAIFFITFIDILYPFHRIAPALRDELMHLRVLIQKYIPQFNYFLNRKGIGLQNFCSTHLLQLFSGLPIQLCFRIWDFMIINLHRLKHARIVVLYTIMLFQQKSQLLAIYPINKIIESVHINFNKIKLDNSAFFYIEKLVDNFNLNTLRRQQSVIQLANEKYLNRFIYGKNIRQEEIFDEDDLQKMKKNKPGDLPPVSQRVQTKLMSLKQVVYPLPSPNFSGYSIQKICIFISGLFLLGNINIHSKKYKLIVNLSGTNETRQIQIKQKSFFVNKFIQLNFYQVSAYQKFAPILQFTLKQQSSKSAIRSNFSNNSQFQDILSGKLRLQGFHKDMVYRENVELQVNKRLKRTTIQMNNLGSSILNIAFVFKSSSSNQYGEIIEEKYQKQTEYLQKILDFDLSPENNEVVKAMNKLDSLMKKVMDPLDQLDVQKYPRLKLTTTFSPRESEWITNSKVSIEQFKAILGYIFSEQNEKPIRLNFSKYYQSYAEKYQKLDLGRFLLQMILMAKIAKIKKISMIFCVAAHYQNIYQLGTSRKLSVQTVNSIICQIIRSTGHINACPFKNDYFGQIKYACYYEKGVKVEEQKKEITQILQDWAYICLIKSQYSGIILGSVNDLSVLRAMLPMNILKQIERQPLCRFEIQYQIKDQLYVWSATVNTFDFSIAKRGVKFLNSYPKYIQNNGYLTSIADILYNCENLIPLESHKGVQFQQFVKIFSDSPFLGFLLTYNQFKTEGIPHKDKNQMVKYQITNFDYNERISYEENKIAQQLIQMDDFTDFAIFRHQNSLPTWKKCKMVNKQPKTLVPVQFKNKQGQFLVPRYEVITMDQASLARDDQISESTIYARHSLN